MDLSGQLFQDLGLFQESKLNMVMLPLATLLPKFGTECERLEKVLSTFEFFKLKTYLFDVGFDRL